MTAQNITQILSTLNPKQLEAVMYSGGPCLIIAGAGTGKTKTLTCKIAKLINDGISPSRILAVTFTNKAAKEMRDRIETMVPGVAGRVWMHTFHSFAVRVLRANFEAANLTRDFVIYDEYDQKKVIELVLEEMGLKDDKKEINSLISIISRAKDDMITPQDFAAKATLRNNWASEVYKRYQQKLTAAGALDFGDLLMKVVDLFKNNEGVREDYQNYFQYVLVDEYQDTNHTQYMLVKTLAAKHRNLCVVGDPDQSIYSWRGANIRNILEFEHDFKDAKIITLEQNYRSTQIILDASNKLIKKNKNRREKSLFTEIKSGEPICVCGLPNEWEEARWVANRVEALIYEDGLNYDDIAVFYRTNAQSRSFENTFRRHTSPIPYRLIGSLRFYDRSEIKDMLSYARLLVNPNDAASLLRVINTPRRGIGESAQKALISYASGKGISLYQAVKENAFVDNLKPTARRGVREFVNLFEEFAPDIQIFMPSDIMAKLLDISGYEQFIENQKDKDPEAASRKENLKELIRDIEEYEGRCVKDKIEPTLSGYLQEVALTSRADESIGAQNGAVTLMTVHLAKGLEFPVVFVTGLEQGLFPLMRDKDEDSLEEERRLCYVAMTRAKKYLHMCYSEERYGKGRDISAFLIDSGLIDEDTLLRESLERRKANYRRNFWDTSDKWTAKNSVSYNNAKNYEDMDFSAPNKPAFPPPQQPQQQQETQPVQSAAGGGVRVGSRVRHGVFGEGRVTIISGSGEGAKITVVFGNGTKRVFIMKYAPLEIL